MEFNYQLPDTWRWATIEEVQSQEKRATITGPFGSSIGRKFFVDEGVPVIRGNNLSLSADKFIDTGFVFISEEKADELKGYKAYPDDLIFTAAGTVGQVGIIPKECSFEYYIISNKQMRVRFDTVCIDPQFAYYWFSQKTMAEYLLRLNTGSTIPLINLSILRKLPIPLPPMSEQISIRNYLVAIDEKIIINRQTNQTLEAMAQALFKSWFVDFDPVIDNALAAGYEIPPELQARAEARKSLQARAEQRQASLSGDRSEQESGDILPESIRQLFPNRFVLDAQMGWIPEGWEAALFSSFCTEVKERVGEQNVPEYSSTNTGLELRDVRYKKQLAKDPGKNKLIHNGDIVFGMSRAVLNFGVMYGDAGGVSSAYKVFKIRQDVIFPRYVDRYIRSKEDIYYNMLSSSSREGQSLSREGFMRAKIVLPSPQVKSQYLNFATLYEQQIGAKNQEITSLENLRDTLLPKLISGEIRLPDEQQPAKTVTA